MRQQGMQGFAAVILIVALVAPHAARADFVFVEEPPAPPPEPAVQAAPAAPAVQQSVIAQRVTPSLAAQPAETMAVPVEPIGAAIPTIPSAQNLFEARAGDTVRGMFERWCADAGWNLIWKANFDFPVQADHLFTEPEVTGAIHATLRSFAERTPGRRLIARAYAGNRVIVVTAGGAP